MQRISRAPELSATLSLDSCWITRPGLLLGLLQDFDQPPALGPRQRAGLDDAHEVTLARLVAGVVRMQCAGAAHDLLVLRMTAGNLDLHRDRLVRLAGDDSALTRLAPGGLTLRRGCSRARLALAALLLPVGAAPAGGLVAALGPLLRTFLRALLRPRLGGLAGSLQPPPGLPVEAFHLIGGGSIRRSVIAGIRRGALGFGTSIR